jgi:hypothetical protein
LKVHVSVEMAKKQKRARSVRREADRAQEKLAATARKLVALEPGGSPDRPIEIESASVVETDAGSQPCSICGGSPQVLDHRVLEHQGRRLRVAALRCKQCGEAWSRYYWIAAPN